MDIRRILLAGVLAAASSIPLAAGAANTATQPQVGDVPPQLLGKDRHGNPVDLGDYRGKVVIVTFWASWCGPCRRELPVLSHFQKTVGHDALEVIAVNFKEARADVNSLIRANRGLDLNYVHDGKGAVSDQYGINAVPHMFILDQEGRIAHIHRGYSEASLPRIIDGIVELLPPEVLMREAGS